MKFHTHSFIKCSSLSILINILTACDSSSTSTLYDPETPEDIRDLAPEEGDTTLTNDNFVANASAFYLASQNLPGVFALQDLFELLLFSVVPEEDLHQIKNCTDGGDSIIDIKRIPASEKQAHLSDSVEFVYRACNDGTSTKDGTRSMLIERLDGLYESDDFNISIIRHEDYRLTDSNDPEDNGDYSRLTDSTLMSKEEGDVILLGIDISTLNASVAPEESQRGVEIRGFCCIVFSGSAVRNRKLFTRVNI